MNDDTLDTSDIFSLIDEPVDNPFFDKNEDFKSWYSNLPHREQPMKYQFVTFRLRDSVPKSALDKLKEMRKIIAELPLNRKN